MLQFSLSVMSSSFVGGLGIDRESRSPLRVPRNDPIVVQGTIIGVLLSRSSQTSVDPPKSLESHGNVYGGSLLRVSLAADYQS